MSRKSDVSVVRSDAASRPVAAVAAWQGEIIGVMNRGIGLIENGDLPPAKRTRKGRQTAKAAAALLRMAPPGLKRKAMGLRLALSGVRRMLAANRDGDALNEAFDRLEPALLLTKADATALRRLVAGLKDNHDTAAGDRAKAAHILANLIRQIEGWSVRHGGRKPLLAAIGTDYRKLRRGMEQAFAEHDIEALHAMRKCVIIHRHQIGLIARMTPDGRGKERLLKREARAKALGVALGQHRDLALLDDLLRGQQSPKLHNAIERTLAGIADEQAALLKEAQRLSNRLMRRSRRDFITWCSAAFSG